MILLKTLNVHIPKNQVLIKVIDDTDHLTVGDINIKLGRTVQGDLYSEGEHSIRKGYLVKLPDRITYNEAGTPWINGILPKIGNIVYFDYLEGKKGAMEGKYCMYDNEIYYIVPFRSLVLHLSPDMDVDTIEMLNGNVLAQKLPKIPSSSLEIKKEYHKDRYVIKKAGKCNENYLEAYKIDDEDIVEGTKVLTRFENYPLLEAQFQNRLNGQSYTYFKRETVVGIL